MRGARVDGHASTALRCCPYCFRASLTEAILRLGPAESRTARESAALGAAVRERDGATGEVRWSRREGENRAARRRGDAARWVVSEPKPDETPRW